MTTRAGLVGLLTGLATTTLLSFLLFTCGISTPGGFFLLTGCFWLAIALAAILASGGGFLAARWSGSVQPDRCAALGGLAGGLGSALVFCLLGAAMAGLTAVGNAVGRSIFPAEQLELAAAIVVRTQLAFLACFGGGSGLGALGGWLASLDREAREDTFDKSAPQMALNAAITAVPASVVAGIAAAVIFQRLADSFGGLAVVLEAPLSVSLLLVLVSHCVLTLVVPHEARQAEHRCGMDEVKMAAYVGIGAGPVLVLAFLSVNPGLFSKPLVVAALLGSMLMSLVSLQSLFRLILPGRAAFPSPKDDRQRLEATLFGTIADSRGPRLVVLCIGCGMVMILPLHVAVFSTLINLQALLAHSITAQNFVEIARHLFIVQARTSAGLLVSSAAVLSLIYLFYLNLGRWFSRWNARFLR